MNIATFDYILNNLLPHISGQDTNMRKSISGKEKLVITLWYLATGWTFTQFYCTFKLGISTTRKIVKEVCTKILNIFKEKHIPLPTTTMWYQIAEGFAKRAHFPNCIGAVDGKHVRVQKFAKSGSMNLNYKHYFSIVFMAVVDSDYKFVYVDIGAYGKDCDSSVFQRTIFWKKLMQNQLNIPPSAPVHSNYTTPLPYVLIGDEAFQLQTHLLRPYSGRHLDVRKRIFNYRLSRARRYVECAFGILANKWRILHRSLNVSKLFAKDIVKACVVLHNIVLEKDGNRSTDLFLGNGWYKLSLDTAHAQQGDRNANDVRNLLSEYFISPEGALPWQMSKI